MMSDPAKYLPKSQLSQFGALKDTYERLAERYNRGSRMAALSLGIQLDLTIAIAHH
jgi:hypothetical protein